VTRVEGNPVLLGALDQALEQARNSLFGAHDLGELPVSTATSTPRAARSPL
jgi:hypothetical protein